MIKSWGRTIALKSLMTGSILRMLPSLSLSKYRSSSCLNACMMASFSLAGPASLDHWFNLCYALPKAVCIDLPNKYLLIPSSCWWSRTVFLLPTWLLLFDSGDVSLISSGLKSTSLASSAFSCSSRPWSLRSLSHTCLKKPYVVNLRTHPARHFHQHSPKIINNRRVQMSR